MLFFKADLMVIVSSPGDPVDNEIDAKCMFSKVFPCRKKIPGSVGRRLIK